MPSEKPVTWRKIVAPYFFDIAAPFLAYLVVRKFGAQAVWALTAGGVVAGLSTAINTIRNKGLDRVGALVILEIAASIAMLFLIRDPRLLLIRAALYTGVASVYLMFTVFVGRPISFDGAKPMATHGDPALLAEYEHVWERSPEFRRAHKIVTGGISLALAVDSILRVVIVYRFPLEESMWISNMPHVVAMVLIVACSALAGRRFEMLAKGSFKRTT
jgi:hypothetical protein